MDLSQERGFQSTQALSVTLPTWLRVVWLLSNCGHALQDGPDVHIYLCLSSVAVAELCPLSSLY